MARQTLSVIVAVVMVVVFCNLYAESKPAISDGNQNQETMCKLPAAKGHCRALLARWWYNPGTGKCQEFDFGGCDGNANNFLSYKACMAACDGVA